MKNLIVLAVTAVALALTTATASTPSPDPASHRADGPINAVLGDASFLAAFGRLPDARTDDRLRIRTHLRWVRHRLEAAPDGHLPAGLRSARARNLERLARYIEEGRFPRNPRMVRERRPNFIDDEGRICAVGYLVRADLGTAAVEAIRRAHQYSFLLDMDSALLDAWQRSSGLSLLELASIQPGYGPGDPGWVEGPAREADPASTVELAVGGTNVVMALVNGSALSRGSRSTALGLAGIGTGVLGGFVAARSDAEHPLLGAAAGFASAILGLMRLNHHDPGEARSANPSPVGVSLGSSPGGSSALAVHVRF
jgi:hypothetical protein